MSTPRCTIARNTGKSVMFWSQQKGLKMSEAPVDAVDKAVEASLRRFHENEQKAKEAEARAVAAEKDAQERIQDAVERGLQIERQADARVADAEREAARWQGQAEILIAQKVKDDAELRSLRDLLAETDIAIRFAAGNFSETMEKLRLRGFRRAGSHRVDLGAEEIEHDAAVSTAEDAKTPAAVNGLRAIAGALSGGLAPSKAAQDATDDNVGGSIMATNSFDLGDNVPRREDDAPEPSARDLGAKHGADNPRPPLNLPQNRILRRLRESTASLPAMPRPLIASR